MACFDTAFHTTHAPAASTYALPEDGGAGRSSGNGFHGLSHAYATRRVSELTGRTPPRLVVCHLGSAPSLAAVRDGRSVDTTMGFTPLEGLVMGTRARYRPPGPGAVADRARKIAADLSTEPEQTTRACRGWPDRDRRRVLQDADAGEERARLALEATRTGWAGWPGRWRPR